jgi:hypothetical protein
VLPVFFCAENAKWPRWEMQRRSLSTSRRAIQPRKCTGAPRALLTCHCEERSDVAISQNTAGQLGSHRRNRNCLPEIATSACGLLAMTNLGADAILTPACTSRKFCAGSGMPLPYNSVCGWRSTREPAASMALSDHRYRQTPARRGCRRAGNCF